MLGRWRGEDNVGRNANSAADEALCFEGASVLSVVVDTVQTRISL